MSSPISSWIRTGNDLKRLLESPSESPYYDAWKQACSAAFRQNGWFRPEQTETALRGIVHLLDAEKLENWARRYQSVPSGASKTIGVIMAGNIPMAGFHDLLCVSMSGHRLTAKLSSDDSTLLPFVVSVLQSHDPQAADRIRFDANIKSADAVIATGSNNTSRYFDYYFGKKPHIFRKNRNSVAVLNGTENEYDLILFGRDIFTYFGLGCRNVSKLYVPEGYSFDAFFGAMQEYAGMMDHNKYMNNYDYNRAVYLLNSQPFLTNNFLILMESQELSSPVSVVFYETYSSQQDLEKQLEFRKNEIQCVVAKSGPVLPGQTQLPDVHDYADGIDTMAFLTAL